MDADKPENLNKQTEEELICAHCGEICPDDTVEKNGQYFCCTGCLFVFDLLHDNGMQDFYDISKEQGITPKVVGKNEFEFLDDAEIIEKLLKYSINGNGKIILYVPEVYCSACIWILENLFRLDKGIIESKVNFLKKEISIVFSQEVTSIRKIVELLTSIGYRPQLNLADMDAPKQKNHNKSLFIKLAVAGFCFGNIMLLSFPEYFSGGDFELNIKSFIGWLNIALAIPVLYAATDYFKSAYNSLKLRNLNIDVPISLGILVLFIRSLLEVVTNTGSGFFDSMSGLVFFLLIGKVFQQKTYHTLSFNRNFKSYFPLSVVRVNADREEHIPVNNVVSGDLLLIRNNEIVPADSVLIDGEAMIDYSFVTGESSPVRISAGEKIYAGGKQKGAAIKVAVTKEFKQSYLTELWNNKILKQDNDRYISSISDWAGKYFTLLIVIIASVGFVAWLPFSVAHALDVLTAVLIIACPCALALTIPFTYGTIMRVFGKHGFFLKNDKIVEKLAYGNHLVLDKTGTLTKLEGGDIAFYGDTLSESDLILTKAATKSSTHPLSRMINMKLKDIDNIEMQNYEEIPGLGIEAEHDGNTIKIGKLSWLLKTASNRKEFNYKHSDISNETQVYISINSRVAGYFAVVPQYRAGISKSLANLSNKLDISVVSGDNDKDKRRLEDILPSNSEMLFSYMPDDKYNYIDSLKQKNQKVIMIGDGLNDAGALKIADLGIAVTENTSSFTPESDAILNADNLEKLDRFFELSRKSINTVYLSYGISILYNIVGLSFALSANLSPVVAAILMPVSSVSVVAFTVGKSIYDSKRLKL